MVKPFGIRKRNAKDEGGDGLIMSSYYTAAQLEAMRKARLKQELSDTIQKLKEQLQTEHSNNAQISSSENIEISVFATDDSMGGYSKNATVTGAMLQNENKQTTVQRDDLDFSGLLFSSHKKPTRLELELDSWVQKVDERPVISEKDEKDRTRLLAELAKTIQASAVDIEDRIRSVKMRVTSYLQGAARVTLSDKANMESEYYHYCALCKMLDVKPTEKYPYRIKKEIGRMTAVLEKRNQDEYIMGVIEDIMDELGCHAKDDAVLDHTVGQIYSVDGHPLCDVFIGNDGSGIMFEPVGESKEGSLEKRRQIESSANSICSLYGKLEEKAAEKGVILKRVYIEPAHIERMCVQSDISERSARKKQRKTAVQKQKAMGTEE